MNKHASLCPKVLQILLNKGTEPAFSGCHVNPLAQGSYLCRGCGEALFRVQDQFASTCGWPSFDNAIAGVIETRLDDDGHRMEVICANCQGHFGHVFEGEGLTDKNLRYCINSLAIEWVESENVRHTEEAIFAAGCFWGVEHLFADLTGVIHTEVGYCGGNVENPSYEQVCGQSTGHFEAVRVLFDPDQITYSSLTKFFFEIHNPSQTDGQGPDIGPQYKGAIFYFNDEQKSVANHWLDQLIQNGYAPTTQVLPVSTFWSAEEKHQQYYKKTGHLPYCHRWEKKF